MVQVNLIQGIKRHAQSKDQVKDMAVVMCGAKETLLMVKRFRNVEEICSKRVRKLVSVNTKVSNYNSYNLLSWGVDK